MRNAYSDAAEGDGFGASVALSGETLVVGTWTAPPRVPKVDALDDYTAGPDPRRDRPDPEITSAYVFVADTPADTPPTITLKASISLWPPNHKYEP